MHYPNTAAMYGYPPVQKTDMLFNNLYTYAMGGRSLPDNAFGHIVDGAGTTALGLGLGELANYGYNVARGIR